MNSNTLASATTLSSPSPSSTPQLGRITEVCLVTPDYRRTCLGLQRSVGIGPFKVFRFTASTVRDRTLRGQPADFELTVCFATVPGSDGLVWEIMQPGVEDATGGKTSGGDSLMAEYLARSGGREGVQHVAFDLGGEAEGKGIEERAREMREERGVGVAMSGTWVGRRGWCRFVFFDTEGQAGTTFETIEFSEDWVEPEFEWFPAPSPAEEEKAGGEEK